MTAKRLLVLAGDGIGPEVLAEAVRVARWFFEHRGVDGEIVEAPYGLDAYRRTGRILPEESEAASHAADAILFGATGGPGYDEIPLAARRDSGLFTIRRGLDLYANLRPVRSWPEIAAACPLKDSVARGADILVVRELTGGIYFGEPRGIVELPDGRRQSVNTLTYTTDEIERVARAAFELARGRDGRVCSIDKSNVLETSLLWRQTVQRVGDEEFADVALSHMLVDNCAMQLVRDPRQFDVMLADNMFGDILSDGAAAIAGSLGMLPSASLGAPGADGGRPALYEPVHGSAPDIAGQGVANPLGAILSVALCLRYSFADEASARMLEGAVEAALGAGNCTADIWHPDARRVTTTGMGDAVLAALESG